MARSYVISISLIVTEIRTCWRGTDGRRFLAENSFQCIPTRRGFLYPLFGNSNSIQRIAALRTTCHLVRHRHSLRSVTSPLNWPWELGQVEREGGREGRGKVYNDRFLEIVFGTKNIPLTLARRWRCGSRREIRKSCLRRIISNYRGQNTYRLSEGSPGPIKVPVIQEIIDAWPRYIVALLEMIARKTRPVVRIKSHKPPVLCTRRYKSPR